MQSVGTVISAGKATLLELQTVYGLQDVYDLLEIIQIDAYNDRLAQRAAEAQDD